MDFLDNLYFTYLQQYIEANTAQQPLPLEERRRVEHMYNSWAF